MVRGGLVLLCLFISASPPAFSQVTSASASTDKTKYLVGDYIDYNIEIDYRKGTTVYPPAIQDSLKDVAIISQGKPAVSVKDSSVAAVYSYTLSCYDSAGVTIPGIPIFYRVAGDTVLSSVTTNPVSFTVSTVPVDIKAGIKDVKSPLKIPYNWLWILLWLACAIIVVVVAYFLYRYYAKKKAAKLHVRPVVKILPHERALKELQELESQKLWQRGLVKEYHSGITEIIRRYFEGRFGMPAMELPTSEAVELLKKQPGSQTIWALTYNFLSNADMVKFAKFQPLDMVNEEMMKQAYEIVNKTAPSDGSVKKELAGDVQ